MKGSIITFLTCILLSFGTKGLSQSATIYGPNFVQPGATEYYVVEWSFPLDPYADVMLSVAGGTIISSNTSPMGGTIYCIVEWGAGPTGYVYVSDFYSGMSGIRDVVIGSPLDPGVISTTFPFYNILSPNPSISQTAAYGGTCNDVFTYTWERCIDQFTWTAIGTGINYPTGAPAITTQTQIRRRVDCNGEWAYTNILVFNYQSSTWENRNFIRTNEIWYAGKLNFEQADNLPIGEKQQSVVFYDGLGRPEQTVVVGAAPLPFNKMDLVTPIEYDALGREVKKHLAYKAGTDDGKFKNNALASQQNFMINKYPGEVDFFAETEIESSPLNRPLKILAPGQNWGGNNVGIATSNDLNTLEDAVRIWRIDPFDVNAIPVSGTGDVYPAYTLNKTTTTDERGKKIIEYIDMEGRAILKKLQKENTAPLLENDHGGWLCTYYIYDDLGRLRFVISPKAVEQMDNSNNWVISQAMAEGLCYSYAFDHKGRLIEKRLPDTKVTYLVYDQRDRLILSQDGKQRDPLSNPNGYKEWSFFMYDVLNRQVATGVLSETSSYSRTQIQSIVNGQINHVEESISIQTDVTETINVFDRLPIYPVPVPWIQHVNKTFLSVNYYDVIQGGYQTATLGYSNGFENIDPIEVTLRLRGVQTATKAKVLDAGSSYKRSTTLYDEKGRVVQTTNTNSLGASIVLSNQYDFSGKLRSSLYTETKVLTAFDNEVYTILSKYEFDHVGRSTKIIKNITWRKGGGQLELQQINSGDKIVVENTYDELGQFASKTLAPGYSGPNGAYLEKLNYEYNIRGWMTAINKNYLNSSTRTGAFFGMELGFDKAGTSNFINTILNGNIAGMAWKTAGDNTPRKFDYAYDNVNRITGADFNQRNSFGAPNNWTKDKFDFSVPTIQYDANGNINRMEQNGNSFSGILPMDRLSYGYVATSNKLNWVAEDVDTDHKLSDFTDKNAGANNIDYDYDFNGNLKYDKNKGITSISYNYLNLPELIQFDNNRGTIRYIYDAAGNKLQKIVTDNTPTTGQVITTTTYSGPIVYTGNEVYLGFEEGRVRFAKSVTTTQPTDFAFDYFVKDHLGNIRMVLTEETSTNTYPKATMETETAANEDKYYYITNRTDKPIELQNNTEYNKRYGSKMSKLTTLGGGNKIGPTVLLKVMAGDVVHAKTDYYYKDNGTQVNTSSLLNDLVSNLVLQLGFGQAGITAKAQSAIIGTNASTDAIVGSLISTQNSNYVSSRPKAFLNYILFDEQFKAITKGTIQVQINGPLPEPIVLSDIAVDKNGWIYVFVNNESEQPVYFDNLQVVHQRGNILEETHYYPFGLTMKAISSRALSINPINRTKFNGKDLQSEEFSDGSGLEGYDFGARMFDAQIGRWHVIDPLAENYRRWSPYVYGIDNPLRFIDPDGMSVSDFVIDDRGNIRWDHNAKDQATTQQGETYIGTTLTLTFNSFIDGDLWDGPMGYLPAGDKLTSTITIEGIENGWGELSAFRTTQDVKIGRTFGLLKGRDYYPGLGPDQQKYSESYDKNKGFSLNFERHSSVPKVEEAGLNALGYNIVNVAQKLNVNISTNGNVSISPYTDIFPSAHLMLKVNNDNRILMRYNQPSFVKTHGLRVIGHTDSVPILDYTYKPAAWYQMETIR